MDTQKRTLPLSEIAGWYGVAAILIAYALMTFTILPSSSVWYQVLNFTGAIGIVIDALSQKNFQPVVLNAVWAVIALIALVRFVG